MKSLSFLITFILNLFAYSSFALSPLHVDEKNISISGISSGAFMAVQMGIAYSETISGIGSIAGGIYSCAQGQALRATEQCMKNPDSISVSHLVNLTENLEKYGYIDSTKNIQKQRIYIFSSLGDQVVKSAAGEKLQEFYSHFTSRKNINLRNTPLAAHGFPTLNSGSPCEQSGLPWIVNCNFDAAGDILKHLLGTLKNKTSPVTESLKTFDQTLYGGAFAGLENLGWIYIPNPCHKKTCKLHVALHGCQMSASYINDLFVTTAGYNAWAESNNIIVLYPQALKNSFTNPNGCWDWFGYTGLNYATKYGPQMTALKNMISDLQGIK